MSYVCGVQLWSQGAFFPVTTAQTGDAGYIVQAPFTDRKIIVRGAPKHPLTEALLQAGLCRFKFIESLADSALDQLTLSGGFTVSLIPGFDPPTEGYVASLRANERVTPYERGDYRQLFAYLFDHFHWGVCDIAKLGWGQSNASDDRLVGGWVSDGKLYLDTSLHFADCDDCIKFARHNGQWAYYDCAKQSSVEVKPF